MRLSFWARRTFPCVPHPLRLRSEPGHAGFSLQILHKTGSGVPAPLRATTVQIYTLWALPISCCCYLDETKFFLQIFARLGHLSFVV